MRPDRGRGPPRKRESAALAGSGALDNGNNTELSIRSARRSQPRRLSARAIQNVAAFLAPRRRQ
jgi:hypothetical protein